MPNIIDISPISYTNKDFRAIYEELLNLINDLTDRWDPKSTNESDPGLVLVKLKAFLADKLNYNIDKNILENFPSQATQRGNAQKLYDILGYGMKYYQSAVTTVTMRYNRGNNPGVYSVSNKGAYTIPAFTQLTDTNNQISYVTKSDAQVSIESGNQSAVEVEVIEGYIQDFAINGNTTINISNLDSDYKLYFTESMIAQNGIFINSDKDSSYWRAVDNLESTQLGQKVFKFGLMPVTNTCYIEFPQDAAALFGDGIHIKYIVTQGIDGNISSGVLNSISNTLENDDIKELDSEGNPTDTKADLKKYTLVIQNRSAVSGKNPESLKQAYRNCQKVIDTFNTLVTVQDYQNAIYNSGVVSNVVVSDRTNDINDSYKVVSKSVDGDRILSLNKSTNNIPNMDAFDIGIYALINVPNVGDADSYDRSFQTNRDTITQAQEAIQNYKSIQHNYKDTIDKSSNSPFIFKNLVSLDGKVLTYQKVTVKEAEEIQKKIKNHLYNIYQARNIDFGKELDYNDLVDEIKNADDRIKTVVLDYPKYNIHYMDSNNKLVSLSDNSTLDLQNTIKAKSILAGVTPYFIFDNNQGLNYSMTSVGSYPKFGSSSSEDQTTDSNYKDGGYVDPGKISNTTYTPSYKNIAAITTSVKIGDSTLNTGYPYTLRENENIFCIGPSYVEKAQLSTCLYYAFISPKNTPDEDAKVIEANSYYTLGEDEYLIATEGIKKEGNLSYLDFTSTSKKHWIYSGKDKSNNIVCPTMTIYSKVPVGGGNFTKDSKIEVSSSDNLGTSNTISILGENKIQINKNNKTIYAAWSLDNLYNNLFEIGDSTEGADELDRDVYYIKENGGYTQDKSAAGNFKGYALRKILQNNDIFIYTDEYKYDLVLLGSGTEIVAESSSFNSLITQFKNISKKPWSMLKVDSSSLSVDGLNSSIEWQILPVSISFFTAEKQIISLGEGVTVKGNKIIANNPVEFNPEKSEKFEYKYEGEDQFTSLPIISGGENWKLFSRLQLITSPTQGQLLKSGQGAILYSGTFSDDGTLNYTQMGTLGPTQYITSNSIVTLPGGYQQNSAVLEASGDLRDNLILYVSGQKEGISTNFGAIKKGLVATNPDPDTKPNIVTISSIDQYSDYTKITFSPPDETTTYGGTIELDLSSQFQGSLIPILFQSIKTSSTVTSNIKFIDDTTEASGGQYLKYIYIPSSTSSAKVDLTLTLSIIGVSSLIIYNPLKIDKKNASITPGVDNIFNELAKQNDINIFDYSYQIDEENQILDPLDPESFFLSNHPFNRWVIAQLDTGKNSVTQEPKLNIKVSKQSYQSVIR